MNEVLDSNIRFLCAWPWVVTDDLVDLLVGFLDGAIFNAIQITALHVVVNNPLHLLNNSEPFVISFEGVMVFDIRGIPNLTELPVVADHTKYLCCH
jgi:hypothetical protein